MSSFQKHKYEELIADNTFIRWATGRDNSNAKYWEEWTQKNSKYEAEFEEAVKTVQLFRFDVPRVSDTEIQYRWSKTQSKFTNQASSIMVRRFLIWGARVAAILVIPLLFAVVWMYQKNSSIQSAYDQVVQEHQINPVTVKAPMGGMVDVQLPDGTKVWLNAGSEIKYPARFSGLQREVSMVGEVFFDVQKADAPFVVNNPGPQIKVYGTQFNVNAYDNEEHVIVALAEGNISLNVNNQEQFLKPGEVSVFNKRGRKLSIKQQSIDQFISWRSGKLIFRDATLSAITRTLERRYNAKIHIADTEIANYTYNAIIRGETFEQILELLTLTAPIKYTYHKPEQRADSSFTKAEVVISRDKNRTIKQ